MPEDHANRWGPRTASFGAIVVVATVSCRRAPDPVARPRVTSEWPVPDPAERPPCADAADLRVCWDAKSGAPARVSARRVPEVKPSTLGFRTLGAGTTARVVDRARDAPPFSCTGDTCVQPDPRMPDDGEWECADFAAVVVCHGGLAPAGVPPAGTDEGFRCGARRGARAAQGERVCVDTSPDMPEATARRYRCRFEGRARVCVRDASAASVGDPCVKATTCATGLACVSGRCVPELPTPACWLDGDCDKGTCRFGSCVDGRT